MVFIFRDCVCALKGSPSKLVSLHGEILFGSAFEVPFFLPDGTTFLGKNQLFITSVP
jgi:hypothetical protein